MNKILNGIVINRSYLEEKTQVFSLEHSLDSFLTAARDAWQQNRRNEVWVEEFDADGKCGWIEVGDEADQRREREEEEENE